MQTALDTSRVVTHPRLKHQTQVVLKHLIGCGSLSVREAMGFGCYRLAARVKEIREAYGDGVIITEMESHGDGAHARYVWAGHGCVQSELAI